jgi:hypothetical protein
MTAAPYTDAGNLADYYRMLCTHHTVVFKWMLADLIRWLDTGQIVLDPPLERPFELCPGPFTHLTIKMNGRLRNAAEFRVRIPVVERSTVEVYPPEKTPPVFKQLTTARPGSYRAQRKIKKAEKDAREAQKGKREAGALKYLQELKLKTKSLKFCEKVCKDRFDLGPGPARRIWSELRGKKPASRKPAKQRTRKV